jgi:hypothetical protein
MDLPPAWSQICPCGRTFSLPQAYTCHKCSCAKTKKQLSGALEKAKEAWRAKKRKKADELAANEVLAGSSNTNAIPESGPTDSAPTAVQNVMVSSYSNIFPLHIIFNIQSDHSQLGAHGYQLIARRMQSSPRTLPAAQTLSRFVA